MGIFLGCMLTIALIRWLRRTEIGRRVLQIKYLGQK
jgi:hypothetical protein